eukprot:scaffold11611_cov25-Tisochrysis_lutea.AAC.1
MLPSHGFSASILGTSEPAPNGMNKVGDATATEAGELRKSLRWAKVSRYPWKLRSSTPRARANATTHRATEAASAAEMPERCGIMAQAHAGDAEPHGGAFCRESAATRRLMQKHQSLSHALAMVCLSTLNHHGHRPDEYWACRRPRFAPNH